MDYAGLGMLSGLTLICAVLAVRTFRARRRWVKLAGGLPMTLLGAIFGAAAILALVGYGKLNSIRPNSVPQLTATLAPQLVADGERFARTCASCHAANGQLPLTGQDFLGAESDLAIGDFWAPNLTPAGLADWSDGEIVRAIRVLGAILIATIIPDESFSAQPPLVEPVVGPDRGPTTAYDGYLVSSLGCQSCHGANLTGGTPGDFNPPPGLPRGQPDRRHAGRLQPTPRIEPDHAASAAHGRCIHRAPAYRHVFEWIETQHRDALAGPCWPER